MTLKVSEFIINEDYILTQRDPVVINASGKTFVFWLSETNPNNPRSTDVKYAEIDENGRVGPEYIIFNTNIEFPSVKIEYDILSGFIYATLPYTFAGWTNNLLVKSISPISQSIVNSEYLQIDESYQILDYNVSDGFGQLLVTQFGENYFEEIYFATGIEIAKRSYNAPYYYIEETQINSFTRITNDADARIFNAETHNLTNGNFLIDWDWTYPSGLNGQKFSILKPSGEIVTIGESLNFSFGEHADFIELHNGNFLFFNAREILIVDSFNFDTISLIDLLDDASGNSFIFDIDQLENGNLLVSYLTGNGITQKDFFAAEISTDGVIISNFLVDTGFYGRRIQENHSVTPLEGNYIQLIYTKSLGNEFFNDEINYVGTEIVKSIYAVTNVNDDPTGAVTITGTASEGNQLTAITSTITDADGLGTFSYQWLSSGAPITGANGRTYTLADDDIGDRISVRITYTDGGGTTETLTSAQTAAVAAIVPETIVLTDTYDTYNGTALPEVISTRGGDDVVIASKGDDQIDGGDGTDRVSYDGDQDAYTVTLGPSGVQVRDRRADGNGTDTLTNIEFLEFDTGDLANFNLEQFGGATSLNEADFKGFIELYIAYFNRAPDAIGLNFWGTAYANGTTMEQMAELFAPQDETLATYPEGTSNTEFATAVYNNVLGRIPDQAGFDFWVDVLDGEWVTRDQFILEVLRGVQDGSPDREYLDNKVDVGAYFAVHKGMSDTANASAAMQLYDGTGASIQTVKQAIDAYHLDALDPITGEFLMPLVGVLDDPLV